MMAAARPSEVWGLSIAEWTVVGVLATAGAFLIAAAAVFIAAGQLRQTRRARLDQARPYVVVTVEPSAISFSFLELVIKNVGSGPARDVEIKVEPPLRRAKEESGHELAAARIFTDPIDMIPPGFEMRSFFDSAVERAQADLPKQHVVTIHYADGYGNDWDDRYTLDLDLLEGALFTEVYNVHHAAKALREIQSTLKSAKNLKGPVEVFVESRDERIARVSAEHAKRVQDLEDLERRMRERQEAPSPDEHT